MHVHELQARAFQTTMTTLERSITARLHDAPER